MKIMDIVKSRWPELLMILVFHACPLFLFGDVEVTELPADQQQFSGTQFLLGMAVAAFGIISQMMLWGFLRTTAVTATQPIAPGQLLIAGRWYFWKLFAFQVILMLLLVIIASTLQVVLTISFYGSSALEHSPAWIQIVSFLAAMLVMLKPSYFIPAVVLARDCSLLESLQAIRFLSLWEMKTFLPIAIVFFVAVGAVESLSALVHRGHFLYYPLLAVQSVVMSVGMIAVYLSAMLEVLQRIPKPSRQQTEGENDES
ncbi:MAG: hypothetical protein ABFD91_11760 [Anaerohalosphaeraceae bacterium]